MHRSKRKVEQSVQTCRSNRKKLPKGYSIFIFMKHIILGGSDTSSEAGKEFGTSLRKTVNNTPLYTLTIVIILK